MLGLFEEKMIDSVILKESSDLDEQLKQLVEFSQKSLLEDIRELVEQDIRNLKAGINGENKLLFELKNSHIPMFVLRDLCIEDGDLSAQIDFFIITKKLFYVIECKNLYGNIEIDSNGNFIRTVHYGKRFQKTGIYSPITQNQRHLELLWKIRQKNMGFLTKTIFQNFSKNVFYRAIVVLANEQTVLNDKKAPKKKKKKVI
ncbi:MAG: NERD domain-containing protein, partial [Fibromonadaceae bacterium]|nr:NERD domain-containing protein [Fibromonadaceae bacterium]